MKKQLFSTICAFTLFLLILSSCSNNSAVIKGDIKNAAGHNLYLEELNISVRKPIDSIKINDKGSFSFNYKFTKDEPQFLILRADSLTLATFLLEKGETLNYSGDFKRPNNYTVDGSQGSVLVKQLNDELYITTAKLDSLTRVLKKAETTANYDTINTKINGEMAKLLVKHKQSLIRFIISNSKSFSSFSAIYQRLPNGLGFFGKTGDMLYYRTLVDSLSVNYPKSGYVQLLNDDYQLIVKEINMQNILDNAEISDGLPEIELADPSGKMIKLSSLRGKVVLIDFWTAADKTLLMNNRELVDIYNKYQSRGFEVYQISEDVENREPWLQAINNQQLKWINVIDTPTSYAARLYNINKLPANYLIDAKGEIIEKNLYGEKLDKKLNEILPHK